MPDEITSKKTIKNIVTSAIHQLLGDNYAYKSALLSFFLTRIHNDADHLAATASIVTLLNDTLITSSSFLFATNILGPQLISKYRATNNDNDKKPVMILFQNGMVMVVALSLLNTPILFFSGDILKIFGQTPQDAAISQQFLRNYLVLIPPTLFELYAIQVLITLNKTKYMLGGSAILVASLLLSYGMSIGKFGFQNRGETGLLTGYGIESYATSIFYGLCFLHDSDISNFFSVEPVGQLQEYLQQFREQLKTVFPLTLTILSELTLSFFMGNFAGILGVQQQDAFALMLPPLWMNTVVSVNFAISALTRVGEMKFSETNQHHVFPTAIIGIVLTVLASSIIPLWMMIGLSDIEDATTNTILRNTLPLFALNSLLDSACYGFLFTQRILNDNLNSSIIRAVGCFASIVLSYLFAVTFGIGMNGIGLGSLLGTAGSVYALGCRSFETMKPDREKYYQSQPPAQSWCDFFSEHLGFQIQPSIENANATPTVAVSPAT